MTKYNSTHNTQRCTLTLTVQHSHHKSPPMNESHPSDTVLSTALWSAFLPSAMDERERSTSRSGHFTHRTQSRSRRADEHKNHCPTRDSDTGRLAPSLSHYCHSNLPVFQNASPLQFATASFCSSIRDAGLTHSLSEKDATNSTHLSQNIFVDKQ
jgi:hypothetical protein